MQISDSLWTTRGQHPHSSVPNPNFLSIIGFVLTRLFWSIYLPVNLKKYYDKLYHVDSISMCFGVSFQPISISPLYWPTFLDVMNTHTQRVVNLLLNDENVAKIMNAISFIKSYRLPIKIAFVTLSQLTTNVSLFLAVYTSQQDGRSVINGEKPLSALSNFMS